MTNRHYPICLDIQDALCVVVGGGRVAERKIASLVECGARVRVISPEITDALRQRADKGAFQWVAEAYAAGGVAGARLVIAATSDRAVNARVYAEAYAAAIPVNTVDDPEHCTFIIPAIHQCGDIQIAVNTCGGAPGVSRRIRDRVGSVMGEEWAVLVRALKDRRDRIRKLPPEGKSWLWSMVGDLDVEKYAGRAEDLVALVEEWLCKAKATEEERPHREQCV